MISLKAFLPSLAPLLLTDPVALYERQRVLYGTELLAKSPGRGPGSGVRLTAQNLALLVISVMASDTLTRAAGETAIMASLVPENGKCSFTHAKNFKAALAAIFSDEELLAAVGDLKVDRHSKRAFVMDPSNQRGQRFVTSKFFRSVNGLVTKVTLPKLVLNNISKAFNKTLNINS